MISVIIFSAAIAKNGICYKSELLLIKLGSDKIAVMDMPIIAPRVQSADNIKIFDSSY